MDPENKIKDLEDKLAVLTLAYHKLQSADMKYRQFIENSNDIIFSLDSDLNVLMVNKRIKDHLGISPLDVIGKSFFDLIYISPFQTESLEKLFILEKVEQMLGSLTRSTLRITFSTHIGEPKEMDLYLEQIQTDVDFGILGRATPVLDDTTLLYCESERKKYIIGNFINVADEVCNRITMNLGKYVLPDIALGIKICLREMIINAIEHGNLNISYDEKTKMKESGKYLQFLRNRQIDSDFHEKKVIIDYTLTPEAVTYLITDEGKGFDHINMIKLAGESIEKNISHGRGIFMTLNTFDIVRYNQTGNEVFLSKSFKQT
ncbi:MAG: ATP-binding protein [Leptospira sp.]|nr:ATP-binding protein [Leptospira sp.]